MLHLTKKCVSLNNKSCIGRQMLTGLNPNELHFYQFIVGLERCDESYNTVEDPSAKVCVPNSIKDVNLKVFNMIENVIQNKNGKTLSVGASVKIQ